MRDIKFRAWIKRAQQIASWEDIVKQKNLHRLIGNSEYPLMQFTGLTDKNGVEIYEGDIVQSHFYGTDEWDDVAVITYCDHRAKFVFNDGNSEQDAFIEGINTGTLEVIGNIHQNKELLK